MVVFLTAVLDAYVTDKTPEMSTFPLNDASPDFNFSAVTVPVNVGDALFALEFNEVSTYTRLALEFNEVST
jgi:hypothetical protein